MKHLNFIAFLLLTIVVSPIIKTNAQVLAKDELLVAAREIILEVKICTLITLDETGIARARAMDAFLPDESFIVWFGTNPKSRKVKQIKNNPNVTLYYFDKASSSYVTIMGKAEIITNLDMKNKHWKSEWSSFYPNFPEGYSLIKVVPVSLEIVSESRGINSDPVTWQPRKVHFEN